MRSVLIVGLGSIGRRHMRNVAQLFPEVKVTVLRHREQPDSEAAQLQAEVTADVDLALARHYDLVILATPSANHIDLLPQLILRGETLLVEKPVVADLRDCDLIEAALKDAPPAVRVAGFNFRYLPSLRMAQRLIASGGLGNLARASFTAGLWLPDWRPAQDFRIGYSADATRGGGVELDLVHEVDVARWFFGPLSMEFAVGGCLSSLPIKANDTSLMVLRPHSAGPLVQIALDYVSRQRTRSYEIVGDEGTLIWNIDGKLEVSMKDQVETLSGSLADFDVNETYLAMLRHITDYKNQASKTKPQTLEDGLASTRIALQARDQGTPK